MQKVYFRAKELAQIWELNQDWIEDQFRHLSAPAVVRPNSRVVLYHGELCQTYLVNPKWFPEAVKNVERRMKLQTTPEKKK